MAAQGLSPDDWQVSTCTSPNDPASLPWMHWRVTTNNLSRREPGPHHLVYLNSGDCVGVYAALGAGGSDDGYMWKFVPTETSIGGFPVYAIYNKKLGGMVTTAASNTSTLFGSVYTQLLARSSTPEFNRVVNGVIFDDVTDSSPQLWLRRNGSEAAHTFKWVRQPGDHQITVPNIPQKSVPCQIKYIVGWQGRDTAPFSDPNDFPTSYFTPILPVSLPNLFIPNPRFEAVSSQSACLNDTCNYDLNAPWSQPCLDYVLNRATSTSLALLLTPRCTQGTSGLDRVLNDRMCSYWCQAGLNDNQQIHDLCFSTRRTSCNRYYDRTTDTGWVAGTSPEIMSRCACYMPNEFYAKQFSNAGGVVPTTGTPNCFYQPCYDSELKNDYFTSRTCVGVDRCLQSGGVISGVECGGLSTPSPDPTPIPVPVPVPVPVPQPSSLSWIWWVIGAIFLIIAIVVVVVLYNRNRQRQQTLSPEVLYALSRSSLLR